MGSIDSESVDLIVTSPPYPMIKMWDEMFCDQNPEKRHKSIPSSSYFQNNWDFFEIGSIEKKSFPWYTQKRKLDGVVKIYFF